jgi:hypothetical protein
MEHAKEGHGLIRDRLQLCIAHRAPHRDVWMFSDADSITPRTGVAPPPPSEIVGTAGADDGRLISAGGAVSNSRYGSRSGPILPIEKGKTRIAIRLDNEVLSWFRSQVHGAGGGNYQKLINQALRSYVADQQQHEPLESVVRRVVREELRSGRVERRQRKAAARGLRFWTQL